jgi:hypothetical protein
MPSRNPTYNPWVVAKAANAEMASETSNNPMRILMSMLMRGYQPRQHQ